MRILLAVDGSDPSLDAARALANLAPAEAIVLLHAIETPSMYFLSGPEVVLGDTTILQREIEARGRDLLGRVAALLPATAGPVTRRLVAGSPAAAILEAAEREPADLIVLGARGLGRFKEMVVGSVSHRVLHHSPCPVWVVHGPVPSLRRVLLPVGGEEDAEAALRFFGKRPFPDSVEVHVLSVVPLSDPLWPLEAVRREALVQQQIEAAGCFVRETSRRLEEVGYRTVGATGLGWPAETILQEAVSRQADLVVMGSHSRKGVKRLLLGSVSHAVLHHAKTSVLLFH
jgi:nucleotide-binding universal stress UspA family protein